MSNEIRQRGGIDWIYFCYSYAIGGLAGGEDKDSFWRVVVQCTATLPEDKPRYVMVIFLGLLLMTVSDMELAKLYFMGLWILPDFNGSNQFQKYYNY